MSLKELSTSKENYLKVILTIKNEQGFVRAMDIATKMGLSRPSVSRALRLLKEESYIYIDNYDIILTQKGLEIAHEIRERYILFYNLFLSLGLSPQTASNDAGKIEHAISKETFLEIKNRYYNLQNL